MAEMHRHADTVRRYWAAADTRDWDAFVATLADDVEYVMPQTRERIRGRAAYLRFNQEYPGDWHLDVEEVVADDDGAVSRSSFRVGEETSTGISFFRFDETGLITSVLDYWPEEYAAPAGREHLVERW